MAKSHMSMTSLPWKWLMRRHVSLVLYGAIYLSCSSCRDEPSALPVAKPPDVSQCSRVEIHYVSSILTRFFPIDSTREILNRDELQYLESLQRFVLDQPGEITAFAETVAQATFVDMRIDTPAGKVHAVPASPTLAEIVCLERGGRRITLKLTEEFLVTEDRQYFRCPGTGFVFLRFTPQIRPFTGRLGCARRLASLSQWLQKIWEGQPAYSGDDWCDAIIRALSVFTTGIKPADDMMRHFRCPVVDNGKCNYALNPDCTPGSPPDVVLLFEAKPGWNQRGGPELFTFDNHDPKGGLVILKGGTTEFIRTQEELKQLRWK